MSKIPIPHEFVVRNSATLQELCKTYDKLHKYYQKQYGHKMVILKKYSDSNYELFPESLLDVVSKIIDKNITQYLSSTNYYINIGIRDFPITIMTLLKAGYHVMIIDDDTPEATIHVPFENESEPPSETLIFKVNPEFI